MTSLAVAVRWRPTGVRKATGPVVWGNVALRVAFSLAWAYVLTVSRNETRTVRA